MAAKKTFSFAISDTPTGSAFFEDDRFIEGMESIHTTRDLRNSILSFSKFEAPSLNSLDREDTLVKFMSASENNLSTRIKNKPFNAKKADAILLPILSSSDAQKSKKLDVWMPDDVEDNLTKMKSLTTFSKVRIVEPVKTERYKSDDFMISQISGKHILKFDVHL
jgi:hypothetical protein